MSKTVELFVRLPALLGIPERAMKELKQAFIQAFKEGLVVYFSPFTGLGRAIRDLRLGSKVHDIFTAPQH